jgi:hypothetical protein
MHAMCTNTNTNQTIIIIITTTMTSKGMGWKEIFRGSGLIRLCKSAEELELKKRCAFNSAGLFTFDLSLKSNNEVYDSPRKTLVKK